MNYIIKRDGVHQPFNKSKIITAVLKAFSAVDGTISEYAQQKANNIADHIEKQIKQSDKKLSIDEIQQLVEHGLMSCKRKDVATAYIEYRHDRDRVRKWNSQMMKIVHEKLQASNVQNQNANIDEYSFGGRRGEADAVILKQYALDNCMSEMAKKHHLDNEIYIHDLDAYSVGMHNCLSIPFDDLLSKGFNTRQTDVRPANSINTAFQLVAVLFQLQSLQQFGGVAATHLDWTLVPYVRKSFCKHYIAAYLKDTPAFLGLDLLGMLFNYYDDVIDNNIVIIRNKFDDWVSENKQNFYNLTHLTEQDFYFDNPKLDKKYAQIALYETILETQQAAEGLFHNLNTLQSRSGNQLPFTSINYGTCTSKEGRLIIKALLDGSIKGVGRVHKTPIFPCSIFQCMKGVNRKPGEPNYDLFRLALKSTAKRLYPNYANVDWSGNAGYDRNDPRTYFSTMGLVA